MEKPQKESHQKDPKSDPFLKTVAAVPKLIMDNKLELLVFFMVNAFIMAL